MNKRIIHLDTPGRREMASKLCLEAPTNAIATFSDAKRTSDQSAKMWASLDEISRDVVWHGKKLTSEQWKWVFGAALWKQEAVPNLDGTGFVVLGQSTSDMSKSQMSDMLELIAAFAVEHDVKCAA